MTHPMSQILHIFRKDIRHHWPAILISLSLLVVYSWPVPREWQPSAGYGIGFAGSSLFARGFVTFLNQSVPLLLMLSWCFVVLRTVQGERLVGDRQFWLTRPYEWQKLLAAKLFLILVFINLPLLIAQLLLLRKAGFPIFPNLPPLLGAQLGVFIAVVWIAVPFAALTSSLGRALLTAVGVFFTLLGANWLSDLIPNASMSVDEISIYITDSIMFLVPVGAILWQYARRRTWQSRGLIMGAGALLLLIQIALPYATLIARAYPPLDSSQKPPIQFTFVAIGPRMQQPEPESDWFGRPRSIQIPLLASGMPEGTVFTMNGARVRIQQPGDLRWDPGWQSSWKEIWPHTRSAGINFDIDEKLFHRIKAIPVTLHIALALSEFHESSVREVTLRDGEFYDPSLGFCRLTNQMSFGLFCRRPAPTHSLMASAPLFQEPCDVMGAAQPGPKTMGYFFQNNEEDLVTPRLSPVDTPYIYFDYPERLESRAENRLRVCPGTIIRLATPVLTNRFRIELQIGPIKLQDYNYDVSWMRSSIRR